MDEWIINRLEDWLGLRINREKTSVVHLKQGESLEFLGFPFRYDRDRQGRDHYYLNIVSSKKSLKKAREAIREKTGPRMCFNPTLTVVHELNTYLQGWGGYFGKGYPRKAFRDLGHYCRNRMVTHLNRRSQRKYNRPKGMSHYQYLQHSGLYRP
jgi:RNA-directed DNA polymerase